MSQFHKDDKVKWDWGQGKGEGEVQKIHKQRVTLTIKGSDITRNASTDNPAYTIEQADGNRVLKNESEVDAL